MSTAQNAGAGILVLLSLSAVVVSSGCREAAAPAAPPAEPAAPVASAPVVARFECERLTLQATFEQDAVVLAMPDHTMTLPRALSASGARYSDGQTTFWNKGNEATLERGGATQMCRQLRDPWREARDRGVDFRAVGQEPGWFLEIDDQREIRLLYDYAEREARAPVPLPVTAGATTTYETETAAGRLRVVVEDRVCQDSMSGEGFPRTVIVTIDGRELRGCGRALTAP